jgi:hypothetical protein
MHLTFLRKIQQNPPLVIVLISLIGVASAHFLFYAWFINPSGHIDPWLYWGTGENLAYPASHFADTYYFRRWTLIIPNYIFQHVFDPYLAQLLIRSMLLLGVMILAGMFAYRITRSILSGVLAVIFLASFEYIVRSIGTSYSQGTGLLLFFLLLNLVMFNKKTERFPLFKNGVVIGSIFCLLLITYQWTIYLFPAIILFALLGFFETNNAEKSIFNFNSLLILISGAITGFVCILILDLAVGRLLGVPWKNFVSYSWDVGSNLSNSGSWAVGIKKFWETQAFSNYSFPLVAILMVSVNESIVRIYNINQLRKLSYLVGAIAGMHLLDPFTGGNSLGVPQTNIYIASLCCVSLGIIVATIINQFRMHGRWSFVYFISAICVTSILLIVGGTKSLANYWWVLSGTILLFSVVLYSSGFLSKSRGSQDALPGKELFGFGHLSIIKQTCSARSQHQLFFSLALLLLASLSIPMWVYAPGHNNNFSSPADAASFIRKLSLEHRSATSVGESARLWVLDLRPHSGWSTNISALYGLYSAVVVSYPPPLASCDQANWIVSTQRSVIVAYGAESYEAAAQTLLGLVRHCGSFSVEPGSVKIINAVTMLLRRNVEDGPSKAEREWQEGRLHPLTVGLDWSQPGQGAKLTKEGAKLSVTTPAKAWNYGAVASLVFSGPAPTRRGVVRIVVSVGDANAGLGFTGSDVSNFIKRIEVLPKTEPQEIFFEFDNLAELNKFVIQTWDKDQSARVQVLDFSVRQLARP